MKLTVLLQYLMAVSVIYLINYIPCVGPNVSKKKKKKTLKIPMRLLNYFCYFLVYEISCNFILPSYIKTRIQGWLVKFIYLFNERPLKLASIISKRLVGGKLQE